MGKVSVWATANRRQVIDAVTGHNEVVGQKRINFMP